mmetsp:Transcript_32223/g.103125  ORF Transcript_32223/g.103125 Transcript_32223/m.103125 type:complete len:237 (-) Transcript_32223:385-1095(-)
MPLSERSPAVCPLARADHCSRYRIHEPTRWTRLTQSGVASPMRRTRGRKHQATRASAYHSARDYAPSPQAGHTAAAVTGATPPGRAAPAEQRGQGHARRRCRWRSVWCVWTRARGGASDSQQPTDTPGKGAPKCLLGSIPKCRARPRVYHECASTNVGTTELRVLKTMSRRSGDGPPRTRITGPSSSTSIAPFWSPWITSKHSRTLALCSRSLAFAPSVSSDVPFSLCVASHLRGC